MSKVPGVIPMLFILTLGCGEIASPPEEPCNPGETGDINLNNIPNQIADAVIFADYFIYGLEAFTTDIFAQAAQTDIDRDCQPLTVGDFVYLVRIIVGDAYFLPPGYYPYPADFWVGPDKIWCNHLDIGAAAFVFEGECELAKGSGARSMELIQNYAEGYTKAFLYSFDWDVSADGALLEIVGDGKLISLEGADYYGINYTERIITFDIVVSADPNPFYPTTTISVAVPRAGNYEMIVKKMSGKQVDYLSGYTPAGILNIEWDASELSDGIYFCQITVEGFEPEALALIVDRSG